MQTSFLIPPSGVWKRQVEPLCWWQGRIGQLDVFSEVRSFPRRAEPNCSSGAGTDFLRGLQRHPARTGAAGVVRRLLHAVPRHPSHPEGPQRGQQRGSSRRGSESSLTLTWINASLFFLGLVLPTTLNMFVSALSPRCWRGFQVWQMREGVCVQVLQRQTPEVHTLRGPGRQEVPLSPLQQIFREERQIKDPHLTRPRKTQASQGNETVRSLTWILRKVSIIPILQTISPSHHCSRQ